MNKEVPKNAIDYSGGQKDAAYTVLGEIVNLLAPFVDDVRIIGGWVPSLLYPDKEHVGSIDVDVLLNQLNIRRRDGYTTIQKVLLNNGYHRHPSQFFTFTKTIIINSVPYTVDVDFLAGMYGGEDGSISKHVNGVKALPATGGNFAFEFPPEDVRIEYQRADGAKDIGHVKVVSAIPFIVMKAEALGRGKSKDAYDIYFCLRYYPGGIRALADSFQIYKDRPIIKRMCQKLSEKFASPDYAGPSDIVSFMGLENAEEIARVRQDAYQRVKYLLDVLKTE